MVRTALFASAALLAVAGIAGTAAAHTLYRDSHVMTVRLPDGTLEHIRYTGVHPPAVSFADPMEAAFAPVADVFGTGSPFVQMDRISAAMDRETAAMLREVGNIDRLASADPHQLAVNFRDMPRELQGYSMVSTASDGHVCSRSIEYFSQGPGKPPRIVQKTAGSCSAAQLKPFHAAAPSQPVNPWHPWLHSGAIQASYHPGQTVHTGAGDTLRLASLY